MGKKLILVVLLCVIVAGGFVVWNFVGASSTKAEEISVDEIQYEKQAYSIQELSEQDILQKSDCIVRGKITDSKVMRVKDGAGTDYHDVFTMEVTKVIQGKCDDKSIKVSMPCLDPTALDGKEMTDLSGKGYIITDLQGKEAIFCLQKSQEKLADYHTYSNAFTGFLLDNSKITYQGKYFTSIKEPATLDDVETKLK